MQLNDSPQAAAAQPLSGCRVLERSRTVAAAYAGRLLAAMGAHVVMLEPPGGSPLRQAAPLLDDTGESALFAYLSRRQTKPGVRSRRLPPGRASLERELDRADILIDDTPVQGSCGARPGPGDDRGALSATRARERPAVRLHRSQGRLGRRGSQHGARRGRGLPAAQRLVQRTLPRSRAAEDLRPLRRLPGRVHGGAVRTVRLVGAPQGGGQYVDVSVQDAVLSVGAFALQRLGDGSLEHRTSRRFRYGGVFEAQDGFIELLTLEDRQWSSLVDLLEQPGVGPGRGAARPARAQPPRRRNQRPRARMDGAAQGGGHRAARAGAGCAGGEVPHARRSHARRARARARAVRAGHARRAAGRPRCWSRHSSSAVHRCTAAGVCRRWTRWRRRRHDESQLATGRRSHRRLHDPRRRPVLHAPVCRSSARSASRSRAAPVPTRSESPTPSTAGCRRRLSTRCRPTSCRSAST